MDKKEYLKPTIKEFGSLTNDTNYNVIGDGRDGAFPDKTIEDAMAIGENELFGS